ncbi:FliH/SctL family protein [Sphingomonas sp. BIUV-7]|uniref:Flagellar assembly protein FliH n=1 Tax=Sphingomonas natans TaxID=3063330 RepID=A0ABT8YDU5_9SPHN|nr:FliH/SctL family protein [Sphingomonas sp. BIUV-7]MDO6416523.1 FliH/SctL family protein [Sphingomonas sp. BIUV-7]
MSDMSGHWAKGIFADAPAVPVWTRPAPARFTANPTGGGTGFSAWASDAGTDQPQAAGAAINDSEAQRAEAYAVGFDEGHRTALAALESEQAAFDRLATALAGVQAEPPADLARLLSETVSRLVRQVVGECAAVDTDLLAERTHAVAALITEDGAPARLRLNPADLSRIDGLRPDLKLIADPSIPEGSVVAETASGWVEDGPAIRLEKLRGLLDQLSTRR